MERGTRKPFYQRGSFWLGPFTVGLGLLLAIGLGTAWYVLGGFPRDHDKYGEVAIPGQAFLSLPEGDVRLNFENHATHSGDSTTLDDRPPGLKVSVTSTFDESNMTNSKGWGHPGAPLAIDDAPTWLFSSTSGNRGHEPYGKIDVPNAGIYLVSTGADGEPAPSPPKVVSLDTELPSVDSGPAISVGQSPWTPFGSKLVGAILCALAVLTVVLLLTLPFRIYGRE